MGRSVHSLRRSLAGATCGTVTVAAIILAAYPARVEGSNGYFPEGVKLPSLPKFEPRRESDAEFERNNFALQGLDGHPTRFLPVNYTRARWFCCPWAFASPPQLLSGRQAVASAVCRRKERAAPTMMAGPVGRRTVLGAGAALFSVLVQGRAAVADEKVGSLKEMMDAEAARKEAIEAAKPKRPTELRDDPQCFVWNGEKRCFTCKTQCEEYKKINPNLDCDKYCTVEYGAPKPLDEDSVSFADFVKAVDAGGVTRVDFYGPSGSKAYATRKDTGTPIRIGEGFPEEIGNEQSSPLQVQRLLDQKGVPYKFHYLEGVRYRKMGDK